MSRYATREELGLYFLIIAIVHGFKILGSLGLDLTLVKFLVSEDKDVQEDTFAAIVWVRIFVMAGFTLLIYLFGSTLLTTFDENLIVYQWYLPVLFTLMSFRELFFFILQGIQKFGLYAVVQTVSAVFKFAVIAVIGLTTDNLTLPELLNAEIAMLVASTLFLMVVLPFRDLSPPQMKLKRSILVRMLRFGFPLYINSIFQFISDRAAVLIVGIFLTPVSIAAYEIAIKIPEGASRLFRSFSTVYYPSVSSLFSDNEHDNAQQLMNKSLILLATFTFSLVLGGLLFSREIIVLVFSESYLDVQPAFVLLMLSVCLQLLGSLMGYTMVAAGHPQLSTKVNVMAMTVELILSLLLIPTLGYIGAAYSYVLMTLIAQALGYLYLRSVDVHIDLQVYLRPFIILVGVSALYLGLGNESFILRVVLFVLYVGLVFTFIPEIRESATYIWRRVQRFRLQKSAV